MSDAAVMALIAMVTSIAAVIGGMVNTFLTTKRDVRLTKLEVRSEVCEKENAKLLAKIDTLEVSNVKLEAKLEAADAKDRSELEAKILAVDVKATANGNGLPPPV